MKIEEIIDMLCLIDSVIPNYAGGRKLGLKDEEIEQKTFSALQKAIDLLDEIKEDN